MRHRLALALAGSLLLLAALACAGVRGPFRAPTLAPGQEANPGASHPAPVALPVAVPAEEHREAGEGTHKEGLEHAAPAGGHRAEERADGHKHLAPPGLEPTVICTLETEFSMGPMTGPPPHMRFAFVGTGGAIDGARNPALRVRAGEVVGITLVNADGFEHDFIIPALGAHGEHVRVKGEKALVVFRAEKPGVYEYFCSIPGHRELGMKGTLIIEAH